MVGKTTPLSLDRAGIISLPSSPINHESTTTGCQFPAWRLSLRRPETRDGVSLCRCTLRSFVYSSQIYHETDCGAKNEIKPREPIRCRECGHRIMYKKRTKRSKFSPFSAGTGRRLLMRPHPNLQWSNLKRGRKKLVTMSPRRLGPMKREPVAPFKLVQIHCLAHFPGIAWTSGRCTSVAMSFP
jgi:DNA-directed RNA polymerase subunit RPC12/RpoP